jgi:hypothetical protein
MPLEQITKLTCDQCKKSYTLSDRQDVLAPDGAEQVIRTTDAFGTQRIFCGPVCLIAFYKAYKCPYKPDSAVLNADGTPTDETLAAMTEESI